MNFESKSSRILATIAVGIVLYRIVTKLMPWIYKNVIVPKLFGPRIDVRKMGSWAVITGSTDGIGKAYSIELARKGMNVVLISRSLEKLNRVAQEIGDEFGVKTKVIDVDFTQGGQIYDKIRQQLEGLEIGVLVNNVGISYDHPEYFVELTQEKPNFMRDIVEANINSVTHMTSLVLPAMASRKKGVIINISSTAGVIPNPLLSIYSATKAFVDKFSVDLQTEYRQHGIFIQSVQPGFVVSNMTKIRKPTLMAPTAQTYVRSALATLGNSERTAGYLPHSLLQAVIGAMASLLCPQFASNFVFKRLLALRKKALRDRTTAKQQ